MNYQKIKKQILVVEDDIHLSNLLKRALEHSLFDILIAHHGDQVREMTQKNNFSLILLDIRLPGKDGFHILQELKAHKLTKSIPVVLLTNLDGTDQVDQGLKLGAIDYLIKANLDFPRLKNLAYTYLFDQNQDSERESIQNALIFHGTDFSKTQQVGQQLWYSWLKQQLIKLQYDTWLPTLPMAWEPNLDRYWHYIKSFYFNQKTMLIGHHSGGTAVLGTLHKLPATQKIHMAVVVTGFYKDEGWNCKGLFSENYDWDKIRQQTQTLLLIAAKNDPYVSPNQIQYLAKKLNIEPIVLETNTYFDVNTKLPLTNFPQLLDLIKKSL